MELFRPVVASGFDQTNIKTKKACSSCTQNKPDSLNLAVVSAIGRF
jgi:hypothetical protein